MIKISSPDYPGLPPLEIDTDVIPSSWYGELALCYFREWEPAASGTVRIEDAKRAYTFGVVLVEERRFQVTGGA